MKKVFKLMIILLTALCIAAVTFLLNKAYLNKHTQFKHVAVATANITPYGLVTSYKLAKVVRSAVPDDAITDLQYFQRNEWFAGQLGIGQGDVIRKSRLVDSKNNPFGKALALKSNKILVGIKTDQVFSAGNNLKPGVLASAFVFIPSNGRDTVDRVIGPLQESAYANLLIKEVQNADVTETSDKGRSALPVVAVVETSPAVAQKLVLAQELGKVYLAPSGVDLNAAQQLLAQNNTTPNTIASKATTSIAKTSASTLPSSSKVTPTTSAASSNSSTKMVTLPGSSTIPPAPPRADKIGAYS